jgi:N-acetylglucosaminyldiphosphoundecaprenol N-acetyl-beta-D-mannosaminyltransferase
VESIEILGVRVDNATYADVGTLVEEWVASRRPHQIVTLNPEMLVAAHRDSSFHQVLSQSDLNVADGVGVVLAARWLGSSLKERITGSDGIFYLCALCARNGYRPFLLGAAPGIAEIASERLQATYPDLHFAGTYAGSPRAEDLEGIRRRIREAAPDLLFVAYGVPAEEIWIAANRNELDVPVMIGVGGTFDFLAGEAPRAPAWIRRLGLEWLYRLLREPWRWKRQLALPLFVLLVGQQWLHNILGQPKRQEKR